MSIAVITELTKSYGAELILRDVSFRVEARDRIGLVGPNGAGKTTLLDLLAGRLLPDGGSVSFARGEAIGYLPQIADFAPERSLHEEMLTVFAAAHAWEAELEQLAAQLADPDALAQPETYNAVLERYADVQTRFEHAGGYTIEPRVRQVLDGLGFTREQQAAPASHLSGGQQTRAALGKLLLQDPDLLLLDEPTNHLDLSALEWLEGYLNAWHGAVIVVSHDRYFLDRVTTRTIELRNQRAEVYAGNYTKYLHLRAQHLERWAREYEAQREHIAHTEEFIRRYKAGQRSKEARGRQTLLDRLERIERPPVDAAITFRMGTQIESGQIVLATEKLVVGYAGGRDGGAGLRVRMADTLVRRGERVGLIGPNGGGKTTLLRAIVGQIPVLEGRAALGHNVHVGYYAQTHEGLNSRSTPLDEIRHASHLSEEGARSYLGRFLFSGDDVFKPISALSGGERSRIALAKLTLQGANFLVLDEPTNHLDLPSRQVLEAVLSQYDGTLILVSHDRYFVDALATTLWALEDGVITSSPGNYTAYRMRRTQAESATAASQAPTARASASARA
ncbi:MAG: ABC-F family ATP-binding cassette domain-containing protein, partial [Ktedonobacterales bacterium]|nr:ABC-F family ATP-binding cassette domain-containing protein [Ktedonobacterales bacterium]